MLERPQDTLLGEKATDEKFYNAPGNPMTTEDWDVLLGRCAAVTDMPCACFAKKLVETYPYVR